MQNWLFFFYIEHVHASQQQNINYICTQQTVMYN